MAEVSRKALAIKVSRLAQRKSELTIRQRRVGDAMRDQERTAEKA